ncbi:MAG: hypothetical protein KZQ89_20895 [Candidatus Thiodiazotropha sp. (ex Lucinoma kastoroae)]|nr:hypothetical protein [Candidatus Thiodiazotropha sp. (ex Lucinoma kastoroae)]
MTAFLDKKRWTEVFSGFEIIDIAIREKTILQMCSRKAMSYDEASHLADHEIPTRIISLFLEMPEGNNCGFQELSGMSLPVLGVSRPPFSRPGGMVSSKNRDGDTWPVGNGNGPMEYIAPGKWPHPNRLKCINGFTYSVGPGRNIYKRTAVGQWELFRNGLPDSKEDIWQGYNKMPTSRQLELSATLGFNDMDAFSESDMYAVGGHGDVWHYDGKQWRQMGFPSNVKLATVTCAGDGKVYISGEGGSLWVGGQSTWKNIYKGTSTVLWNDVLWFEDKLWLASDYQFRIWNGKALETVTHNGAQVSISGNMDVFDGVLAIASLNTVMTFDGQEWRTIVSPYLS